MSELNDQIFKVEVDHEGDGLLNIGEWVKVGDRLMKAKAPEARAYVLHYGEEPERPAAEEVVEELLLAEIGKKAEMNVGDFSDDDEEIEEEEQHDEGDMLLDDAIFNGFG